MKSHAPRITVTVAARRLVSAALRLLLVVSLWHAPLPWMHEHPVSAAETSELARHVAHFHADEHDAGIAHLRWHLHLVLPWCPAEHHEPGESGDSHSPIRDGCLDGEPTHGLAASGKVTCPIPDRLTQWSDTLAPHFAGLGSSAAIKPGVAPTHMLGSFAPSVSVSDLLGVYLC